MQEKDQKVKITLEQVAEIRPKLPKNYSKILSEMVSGQYKASTISLMVRNHRTMKPVVFEAANKLIDTIENLKSNQNEN